MVARVFEQVRAAAARGAAVIYISHRLHEVREIAERVTVMRDGEVRATAAVDAVSDDEILRLIVGRAVSMAFPAKGEAPDSGGRGLTVTGVSGERFEGVSLVVRPGEIVGLAGITGNGQGDFLRALAGLVGATGEVRLDNRVLKLGRPPAARKMGITYLSSDRHNEGLLMTLSVRENTALSALARFASKPSILWRRSASLRLTVGPNSSDRQPPNEGYTFPYRASCRYRQCRRT